MAKEKYITRTVGTTEVQYHEVMADGSNGPSTVKVFDGLKGEEAARAALQRASKYFVQVEEVVYNTETRRMSESVFIANSEVVAE